MVIRIVKTKKPNTLLALGFDTDISDSSIYGTVFTPVNNPIITGGDLSVSVNSFIYTPDTPNLGLGSSDFTLEARIKLVATTGARNLIVKQTTVGIFPIRMYLDSPFTF